ncbi:amylo-alpha-1,6-glucosidase [Bauldia sp.]|uniref:amylo-alpha-1,6-glucosidase n=1 Tax=Bauldia sp. TaxID=2575872 RepID=UPI003BA90421
MNANTLGDIDRRAIEILQHNDRGGYTVPTDGLYPFQWNWDSMFVALGFAVIDCDRAWREIETLFAGQWPDGMVPHIIFRGGDTTYFPGPDQWGTRMEPATSGITQPPVAATIVRQLYDNDPEAGASRARALLPAIDRWHQWFRTARDPEGRGVVAAIHPWETGRDNAPDWDAPLGRVDVTGIAPYQRRDTQHVHASQRPENQEYDRYLALVQFGREHDWDIDVIAERHPFWVADVGLNAILLRAEDDLAGLAGALGETAIAARATERARHWRAGIETLWNDRVGAYVARDLRRDESIEVISVGSLLPLYPGITRPERAARTVVILRDWMKLVRYSIPSFDPADARFDAVRYWRGPVWAVVNWMIADGLGRSGIADLAERVHGDTRALIEAAGFFESFDPTTGAGCGGHDFSWTAAIWLAWASPTGCAAVA